MFQSASIVDPDVSGWDTSNITDMGFLFRSALVANPDVSNWNTSNVIDMQLMFRNTPFFNSSLVNFDMTSVESANNMLSNSRMSRINYDATLISWSSQSLNSGVNFRAIGMQYCNAETERIDIINNFSWNINADTKFCSAIVIDPGGITTTGLTIPENAGTGSFTLELGSQPFTDVVIDVSSNDINEVTVDLASLTFTNINWNIPQTVTVT
jgi:hypothetical protein